MTKPTNEQLEALSDKIEELEAAVWSLHEMLTAEEVSFELDFPLDESEYH